MKKRTTLEYLKDTYFYTHRAIVVDAYQKEDLYIVILQSTIFYPQGGGQPSDTGTIASTNGLLNVKKVTMDHGGIVLHQCDITSTTLKKGDEVTLEVDENTRKLHARLHSAGHIIDCAVNDLGLKNLVPLKGFHFREGPYVEYQGTIEDTEQFTQDIEEVLDRIIREKNTVHLTISPASDGGLSQGPKGKDLRTVEFGSYGAVGCGGTHVQNSHEIGSIKIRKIKNKKGNVKISYLVE